MFATRRIRIRYRSHVSLGTKILDFPRKKSSLSSVIAAWPCKVLQRPVEEESKNSYQSHQDSCMEHRNCSYKSHQDSWNFPFTIFLNALIFPHLYFQMMCCDPLTCVHPHPSIIHEAKWAQCFPPLFWSVRQLASCRFALRGYSHALSDFIQKHGNRWIISPFEFPTKGIKWIAKHCGPSIIVPQL